MSGVTFGFQSESVQFVWLFRPARHQFENRRSFIGVRSACKKAGPNPTINYNQVSQARRLFFFFFFWNWLINYYREWCDTTYAAMMVAMSKLKLVRFSGRLMILSGWTDMNVGAFLCDSTTKISKSIVADLGTKPWSVAVARILNL